MTKSADISVVLFDLVLRATVSATVLAVLISAIQGVLGRRLSAAWRYALWVPVLLRLMVPVLPESRFSIFNAPRWFGSAAPEEPKATITYPDRNPELQPILTESPLLPFAEPVAAQAERPRASISLSQIIAWVWIFGAAALLARLAIGTVWLRVRLARTAIEPTVEARELLASARLQLGRVRAPRLIESACVNSPGLFGCFRPSLLLPAGIARQLSSSELRHVLLHELAHLKRGDLWLNAVMSMIQALHWFNPVVWLVLRRMRLERELACDALVMESTGAGQSQAYGNTILKLLERLAQRPSFPAVVGILEEKQAARSRLKEIARFQARRRSPWKAGVALLALVTLAGLSNAQSERVVVKAALAEPQNDPTKEPAATSKELHQEGIDALIKEYNGQQEKVKQAQRRVEALSNEIGLEKVAQEFYSSATPEKPKDAAELMRERDRLVKLKRMTPEQWSKADSIALPDATLERLLSKLDQTKHTLGELLLQKTQQHPDVIGSKRRIATLQRRIEKRIDALIEELEAKLQQTTKSIFTPVTEQDKQKLAEFYAAKAALEKEQRIEGSIYMRILAEKVDAKISLNQEQLAAERTQRASAKVLIQDARLLMELGKLDEAEGKVKQVLGKDPNDEAALYYLQLIKERRFNQEARKREPMERIVLGEGNPWRSYSFGGHGNPPGEPKSNRAGRANLLRKLESIILPEWKIPHEIELSEAVKELNRAARENDPDATGVNFIVVNPADPPTDGVSAPPAGTVEPVSGFNLELTKAEDFLVRIFPPLKNVRLLDAIKAMVQAAHPRGLAPAQSALNYTVQDYAVVFSRAPDNRESKQPLSGLRKAPPIEQPKTAPGNPSTNSKRRVHQSAGRERIAEILAATRLPRFERSSGTSFSTAIKELSEQTRSNSPDTVGVNFIVSSFTETLVNPVTGEKREEVSADVREFVIPADIALVDRPAREAVDKLVEMARPPAGQNPTNRLAYAIEDDAVVFKLRVVQPPPLYTRTYRVNPNIFLDSLRAAGAKEPKDINEAVRVMMSRAGVNFEATAASGRDAGSPAPPQKAMFFNDRTGILMVRATLQDLDAVETVIHVLNSRPPQVTVEFQIVEMKGRAAYETELLLREVIRRNRTKTESLENLSEIISDPHFKEHLDGLRDKNSTIVFVDPVNEIFTEPLARSILDHLAKVKGVTIVAAPRITTVSGRQARISIEPGPSVDVLPLVRADGQSIELTVSAEIPPGEEGKEPPLSGTAKAVLWDNQTLVVFPNQVPGRTVFILVTPTIIDAAGNRVHSPETLPDANTVPLPPRQ